MLSVPCVFTHHLYVHIIKRKALTLYSHSLIDLVYFLNGLQTGQTTAEPPERLGCISCTLVFGEMFSDKSEFPFVQLIINS